MELILNVETHFQTFRLLKDTMTDILSVHPNNTNINITLCTNLPNTCQVHSLLSSLTACSMHTQHTRRTNLRVLLMHFNSLQPELRAHLLLSGRVYIRLCLMYRTCWTDRTMHHVFNLSSVKVWTDVTVMRTTEQRSRCGQTDGMSVT